MAVSLVAASVLVLRALAATIALYASLLPLVYVYGRATCPSEASFDAKYELRRVLRGDYEYSPLPSAGTIDPRTQQPHQHQPHPPQSRGGLAGFVKGAMAVLASELETHLPGYEVALWNVGGAAVLATVTLPASNVSCTWIGCNHRWYYWGSKKLEDSTTTTTAATTANSTTTTRRPMESASVTIGNTNIKFDFGKQD